MIRAGTGKRTITPPIEGPIAGLFERRTATSVADDLFVQALVIESDAETIALVLCDLICISGKTADLAKARIAELTGIPPGRVMISCTHTHTGPATVALLNTDPDPAYLDWLPLPIADAVAQAIRDLVPARIATGSTRLEGVCFNRRFHMNDGTVQMNPGVLNPDVNVPAGPTDPDVLAIRVESLDGEVLAIWANLALHYVGADDPIAISADYFGHFSRTVATMVGGECLAMLTNGASGNINNVDVSGREAGATGIEQARRVGMATAAAALVATTMQPRADAIQLAARSAAIGVQRRDIPESDITRARSILASESPQDRRERFSFELGHRIPSQQLETYACEVLHVAAMPSDATAEIQVFRIGDVQLVAVPGEIFVEFGLAVKHAAGTVHAAIVGLANDYIGYLPTLEAFDQGGYETWAARSAWTAPGAGEALMQEAVALLD